MAFGIFLLIHPIHGVKYIRSGIIALCIGIICAFFPGLLRSSGCSDVLRLHSFHPDIASVPSLEDIQGVEGIDGN